MFYCVNQILYMQMSYLLASVAIIITNFVFLQNICSPPKASCVTEATSTDSATSSISGSYYDHCII